MSGEPLLEVGYVSRAHGLAGELAVKTHDPSSTVIDEVDRLFFRPKEGAGFEAAMTTSRRAATEWLVRVEGVSSREAAEALRGSAVCVFREDVAAPNEGEWFQGDLVGLEAVDGQSRAIGRVEALWHTGPVPVLVIRRSNPSGDELLLPFAEGFVGDVKPSEGRIVVFPPEATPEEAE